MDELELRVRNVLSFNLGVKPDSLNLKDRLDEDLSMDSLDRVEVLLHLEEEFEVEIYDDIMDEVTTVSDVVQAIGKITSRSTSP